jgi:hypothetical protein
MIRSLFYKSFDLKLLKMSGEGCHFNHKTASFSIFCYNFALRPNRDQPLANKL